MYTIAVELAGLKFSSSDFRDSELLQVESQITKKGIKTRVFPVNDWSESPTDKVSSYLTSQIWVKTRSAS
jgi:phage gp16-like protein